MIEKTKNRNFFRAAGVALAVVMCPCIIAFGLGMAQADQGQAGTDMAAYAPVEAAYMEDAGSGEQGGTGTAADGKEKTGEGIWSERETVTQPESENPRERAELMARIKHLADYSKEDSGNPDYREKGYIYTEEMYYKLTGATELPDDWTDRMGPLMRGLIKEEARFVETPQTDDGEMQEQWQPDEGIDTAVYQAMSCTGEVMPGALGAVQAAQRRLGYPYSQARRDSGIAYDCSSLVYWSYLEAGVNIDPVGGHTAADIAHYLESTGRDISGSDLRPGDLIFYSYKRNGRYKNISHVAMVAGDGMIVHASSSRKMVVMSGLTLERAVAVARPVMEGNTEDLAAPDAEKETEEELSQEVRPADYGPGTQESQDAGESATEETGGVEYQESVPESMANLA